MAAPLTELLKNTKGGSENLEWSVACQTALMSLKAALTSAAQARLGHVLAKRSLPATLNVGDLLWMDSRHTPNDIPFKLTARWFGPFTVLQVKGAQATLDLPSTFSKAHRQVNIVRLEFFEPRDSELRDANLRSQPLWDHDGVPHYEISR